MRLRLTMTDFIPPSRVRSVTQRIKDLSCRAQSHGAGRGIDLPLVPAPFSLLRPARRRWNFGSWLRRRTALGPLLLLPVLGLGGCGKSDGPAPAPGTGRVDIRFAHVHAPDPEAELHHGAVTFAAAAAGIDPRLDVKVYPQGTLGSEREVYEGMQLGSGASCTISGTAILNNFDRRIGVLDLPYLWKDFDHVHRVLDGEVGRELAAEMEKQGLVILAWMDGWGWRNLMTTQRAVRRPEDLRGMKIRTIPTPIYLDALRMMGANPTPMSYGEIYTGLQTGVIDGFEQASAIIQAERFYEVAKNLSLSRHLFGVMVICYSQAQWNRLSPADQAALRKAAEVARDKGRAKAPVREREALQFLQDKGVQVHPLDTSGWEQASVKVQDRIAAELGATDLLEKIRRAATP